MTPFLLYGLLLLPLTLPTTTSESPSGGTGGGLTYYSNAIAEEGRTALQHLQKKAKHDPCFASSYEDFFQQQQGRCSDMIPEQRRRFAVQLTLCHLRSSGVPVATRECGWEEEGATTTTPETAATTTSNLQTAECISYLSRSTLGFQAYTDFFIQAETMCYFLEREHQQSEMQSTIGRLYQSAGSVADHLQGLTSSLDHHVSEMIDNIQAQQLSVLDNKQQLTDIHNHLQTTHLEVSSSLGNTNSLLSSLLEAHQQAHEETHSSLSSLSSLSEALHEKALREEEVRERWEKMLRGDFSSFGDDPFSSSPSPSPSSFSFSWSSLAPFVSFLFGLGSWLFVGSNMVVSYFCTIPRRTSSARPWLFLLALSLFFAEQFLSLSSSLRLPLRSFLCLLQLGVLLTCGIFYRDMERETVDLLWSLVNNNNNYNNARNNNHNNNHNNARNNNYQNNHNNFNQPISFPEKTSPFSPYISSHLPPDLSPKVPPVFVCKTERECGTRGRRRRNQQQQPEVIWLE